MRIRDNLRTPEDLERMIYREKMRQNMMEELAKYIHHLPKKLVNMDCDNIGCSICPLNKLHICQDPDAIFNWDQEMPADK